MPGLLDALKDPEFRRQVLQGLTDAGNRGLAAGLGGPVDLAELVVNAGLGLAGQKPISNSVGGSEWIGQQMQRVGSVSDVRNPTAEFLASLLMPGASVKGAKVIGKAVDNAQKPGTVARAGERGAIVYHGTPHKFDKFDSSKIGTGEGAQAYGHGLYLAENKDIAKWYRDTLGRDSDSSLELLTNGGKPLFDHALAFDDASVNAGLPRIAGSLAAKVEDSIRSGKSYKQAISSARKSMVKMASGPLPGDKAVAETGMKFLDEIGSIENPAKNLYKIDLPDDQISKMLDWDSGGKEAWREAVKQYGSPSAAAQALRSQGIPGIRYLDGTSRSSGNGTSNFVVFPGEEAALSILERNGRVLK